MSSMDSVTFEGPMYTPDHFRPTELAEAHRLMADYPFATLLAFGANGEPFVSHLPLLLEPVLNAGPTSASHSDSSSIPKSATPACLPTKLVGHMSRRNPQWQLFQANPQTLAIFHGPHTYITPRWYSQHDVPTWNYAVVHARGTIRLIERHQDLVAILARMTERFEGTDPNAWRFSLPADLRIDGALTAAIVGFELTFTHVEAKLKLSQNRDAADRRGVIAGLSGRTDDESRGVLELMRQHSSDGL